MTQTFTTVGENLVSKTKYSTLWRRRGGKGREVESSRWLHFIQGREGWRWGGGYRGY